MKNVNKSRRKIPGAKTKKHGQSDDENFAVLSLRTLYDQNGLETKRTLNIRLGSEMIVIMNIPVDSASPVSFLKQNVIYELKLRCPNLNNHPVNKRDKQDKTGSTDKTINILCKIVS